MKILKLFLLVLCALSCVNLANAQCNGESWNFDEDDFAPGDICATEANPNPAPVTTNQVDLNGDGTNDVEMTYQACVVSPNSHPDCDDPTFVITAAWGNNPLSCPGPSNNSDYGASGERSCICEHGFIIQTIDFLNGWNTDAANFEFDWSSINGLSEGYEYGFGFVSMGTDAGGAPLSGLYNTANLKTDLTNYCNAMSDNFTPISDFVLGAGAIGAFDMQGDGITATVNDCPTSGENGTDVGSGSGPNSGGDSGTGISTLNPTDLITQVTFVYGYSVSTGTTCNDIDGINVTGVSSNPSGSFSGISGCFAALCGYTLDPADIIITESCGIYSIEFINLAGEGAADPVTTEAYNILIDGTAIASGVTGDALATTDITANITPGTPFTLTIQNAADTTCSTDLMLTPPPATTPNVPAFVPCTTGTTGIGG